MGMGMEWVGLIETLEVEAIRRLPQDQNARWAVQIEGDADDISDLYTALNESRDDRSDPFVMNLGGVFALACEDWNQTSDAQEVQALGQALLNDCIGCLNLANGCGLMKVGTIYQFFDEENKCILTRCSPVQISVKKPKEDRSSPRYIRDMLKLARSERWLSQCMPLYYEEPNFYTVYKAVEAIKRLCNGESNLKKRTDLEGAKLVWIKTVADFHRHAQPVTREQPKPFYSLQECINTVTNAISVLVEAQIADGSV
ncbi:hypothetical protein [Sphingobium phenoxybenzoativorans]|uniref:hypothetical protein n=1 Tax=Sphingobium phenoxybenzoativorans TaxID=1592790 RepID=UPI0008727131|nr:hypothetical protein [Sphingobium phenoxybenzoativorans]